MSDILFYKYQGAGNDFVVIDNRTGDFDRKNTTLVKQLCDRRMGVGADGLMLLDAHDVHDFEMVYYNADGNEGSMCGNGGRCIVKFAHDLGVISDETVFLAVDGVHEASVMADQNWVSLKMMNVSEVSRDDEAYVLNTGSPHYVSLVHDLENFPVFVEGQRIRYNNLYRQEGINVNFVAPFENGYFVRTYERGVEDETLACGTGATAVALAMAAASGQDGNFQTPIRVLGGQLNVLFEKRGSQFTNVYLEGPASFVFQGKFRG